MTWAAFIGDNERKRWDASLPLPSPPRCSFISPSYKADSPLVTSAAATLKIDNKVSGMKTGGQLWAPLPLGFKLAGQRRALWLSWRLHLSGHVKRSSLACTHITGHKQEHGLYGDLTYRKIQFSMHFPSQIAKRTLNSSLSYPFSTTL